jgi:NAD-dependent protein deacetylase/lipoamidase
MSVAAAADRLRSAHRLCVLTGSGISAESGIPTFRGAQTGLWENFNPHQLATPEAFERDPRLVWRWYEWRRELIAGAQPNAGHHALVEIAHRIPAMMLVTQNVDGLHQRAGSHGVIEFHGNIMRDRCTREGIAAERSPANKEELPRCARCGALLRPDVVWFGEAIAPDALQGADAAAANCDVFMSVGTSSQVYPAAGLSEIARQRGAAIIEVNVEASDMSAVSDWQLLGPAGEVLPALASAL